MCDLLQVWSAVRLTLNLRFESHVQICGLRKRLHPCVASVGCNRRRCRHHPSPPPQGCCVFAACCSPDCGSYAADKPARQRERWLAAWRRGKEGGEGRSPQGTDGKEARKGQTPCTPPPRWFFCCQHHTEAPHEACLRSRLGGYRQLRRERDGHRGEQQVGGAARHGACSPSGQAGERVYRRCHRGVGPAHDGAVAHGNAPCPQRCAECCAAMCWPQRRK